MKLTKKQLNEMVRQEIKAHLKETFDYDEHMANINYSPFKLLEEDLSVFKDHMYQLVNHYEAVGTSAKIILERIRKSNKTLGHLTQDDIEVLHDFVNDYDDELRQLNMGGVENACNGCC